MATLGPTARRLAAHDLADLSLPPPSPCCHSGTQHRQLPRQPVAAKPSILLRGRGRDAGERHRPGPGGGSMHALSLEPGPPWVPLSAVTEIRQRPLAAGFAPLAGWRILHLDEHRA